MITLINLVISRAVTHIVNLVRPSDLYIGVASNIPLDKLAAHVYDALDYGTLASHIDYTKMKADFDYTALAQAFRCEDIPFSNDQLREIAEHANVDSAEVAANLDLTEIAEQFVFSEKQMRVVMRAFSYEDFNATLEDGDYTRIAEQLDYVRLLAPVIDNLDMTVFARQVGSTFGEDGYRHVGALLDVTRFAHDPTFLEALALKVVPLIDRATFRTDIADLVHQRVADDIHKRTSLEVEGLFDKTPASLSIQEECRKAIHEVEFHDKMLGAVERVFAREKAAREDPELLEEKRRWETDRIRALVRDELTTLQERNQETQADRSRQDIVSAQVVNAAVAHDGSLFNKILDRAAELLLARACLAVERGEVK